LSKITAEFEKWYSRVREDPLVFAREALCCIDEDDTGPNNPKLTEQQVAMLVAVKEDTDLPMDDRLKRVAVKSGQGTGKTTNEVILAMWRVFLNVDNLVMVTAPTAVQVKDVWFAELGRILQGAHPFIRKACKVTAMKCVIFGRTKTWGIWGRTAARPESFQGYHATQLTFILDEASGIDREIIRTIKGTLTNSDSLMVCAGNPNTRECAFFDMFNKPSEKSLWHRFTFNSEDSPITDKENIRRIEQEFGRDSDVYRVRVLGEFPLADPNCVMSSDDLWACTGISMVEAARMRTSQKIDKVIAIDFARFGGDESVIYRRSGHAIVESRIFAHTEPIDVIDAAMQMQKKAGWTNKQCWYVVDAGGMGQGVLGILHRARKQVHEFHTQARSSAHDYSDKMTEAYFNVAKMAKQRRLHVPDDEHLVHQLCSRLYETDNKGKLKLEKKDQFMKRMEGLSPDRADAYAMAFYQSILTRGQVA
jgi:hypothetical protein